jgi:hypothetical protein
MSTIAFVHSRDSSGDEAASVSQWAGTRGRGTRTRSVDIDSDSISTTSRSSIENTPDFFGLSDFSDTSQIFDIGIVDFSGVSLLTRIFGNHST